MDPFSNLFLFLSFNTKYTELQRNYRKPMSGNASNFIHGKPNSYFKEKCGNNYPFLFYDHEDVVPFICNFALFYIILHFQLCLFVAKSKFEKKLSLSKFEKKLSLSKKLLIVDPYRLATICCLNI